MAYFYVALAMITEAIGSSTLKASKEFIAAVATVIVGIAVIHLFSKTVSRWLSRSNFE
ncbi:MAG: multidrug transporter EmrE-like cation transporter [Psychroserpens sp.]|jgi:multidrug transporter EmrE-like cation transporter